MNLGPPSGFIQEWFSEKFWNLWNREADKRRRPMKGKNNYGGNWQKRRWMMTSKSVEYKAPKA